MILHQTISNAFADGPFTGNPAATIVTEQWLPDAVMQSIAAQNNLPETTFLVPAEDHCAIRWFTPKQEVYLPGHATLAAAHCLRLISENHAAYARPFRWARGEFAVSHNDEFFWMDFDAEAVIPSASIEIDIIRLFRAGTVLEILQSEDIIFVLNDEFDVARYQPDFNLLSTLPGRGVAITARSSRYDYVSRFFCPKYGVPEDPVTGSSHAVLAQYWSGTLSKRELVAYQCSQRGGIVHCDVSNGNTRIGGNVMLYSESEIYL